MVTFAFLLWHSAVLPFIVQKEPRLRLTVQQAKQNGNPFSLSFSQPRFPDSCSLPFCSLSLVPQSSSRCSKDAYLFPCHFFCFVFAPADFFPSIGIQFPHLETARDNLSINERKHKLTRALFCPLSHGFSPLSSGMQAGTLP
mmetsp:Transcript_41907/g.82759  ORF Transcript_41907/g.82759 Transcript_41907/m.82759 type:complete len:142 (+) Transcript_41907:1433-1858(+)